MIGDRPADLSPSAVRKQVGEVWRDVLGVRPGQENATFFELAGQSISAVRIVARIEDELGILVDVGVLFDDPDLETFTGHVLTCAENTTRADSAAE